MIKYIGSKRLLLPHILAAVRALSNVKRVVDLFSGTARVGRALKEAGFDVVANDHLRYSATLARCYVEADPEEVTQPAQALLKELSALPGREGYFTKTFCQDARYFQPHNGMRIDAMRDAIAAKDLSPTVEAVVLTALMEAADRVDNTTGVQMAYLKQWARRSYNNLELRMPALVRGGSGRATELEALVAGQELDADVAYLDPPYNQHSYLGNYHVWETLVRWDAPEVYGVACKRIDCRERKSDFNSKRKIRDAFSQLVQAVRAPQLIVSFNDEGFLQRDEVVEVLKVRGHVGIAEIPYGRYVGAKIGIHNPKGQKVGTVSHTKNHELLYVVSEDEAAVTRACDAVRALVAS
ncbi:MAG: DNA adenine methylase [Myxococcota bacterium]